MASAVPCKNRFGKHYQIIVQATNGVKTSVFHKLRIDPPLMPHHKHARKTGIYVTDVWDDIRELTSGYFAGKEPMRTTDGGRFHKQQSPIALLLRIILSSSKKGDMVFDPFAGTGTTLVVANQLQRKSIGVEIDPQNISRIEERINKLRVPDCVEKFFHYYRHTENIDAVWGKSGENISTLFTENRADDSIRIPSV
ncbi:DNA methyltransferase [Candidatus Spongiihabitans sp.]|uniref:DNA methyltransferase n=1 Tax=Candidatus Spongiihabitans sp. TaxID=3101308 RepID=UPI003C6F4EA9